MLSSLASTTPNLSTSWFTGSLSLLSSFASAAAPVIFPVVLVLSQVSILVADAKVSSNVFGCIMATYLPRLAFSPTRKTASIMAGVASDLACFCFNNPAKSRTLCSFSCLRLLKGHSPEMSSTLKKPKMPSIFIKEYNMWYVHVSLT